MSHAAAQSDFQVLKFDLGSDTYCIDIGHIDEIVDATDRTLTPLPNQPQHVRGVMDLRGRTTMVVDPKVALGLPADREGTRIVVFDADDGTTIGWVIDEARQVIDVADDEVDRSTADQKVLGVVRGEQEEEFIIWVDPNAVNG